MRRMCDFNKKWLLYRIFLAVLLLFVCISGIHLKAIADEVRSTEGTAYAVLTDAGELILFRSNESYSAGAGQTVTDIKGNTYTGRIYPEIEKFDLTNTNNSRWYSQSASVKSFRVADGQKIIPKNCSYWFSSCNNMNTCNLEGLDTSKVRYTMYMFRNCSSLTALDISGLDTKNVINMSGMFFKCSGLTALDASAFNTRNVTTMNEMFNGCSKLVSLNLSGFDMSNASAYNTNMFDSCSNLKRIVLSEKFSFGNNRLLPTPPTTGVYKNVNTGKWIREDKEYGPFTSAELKTNYTSAMSGVWIWEEIPNKYTIIFLPPDNDNYSGSMEEQRIIATQNGALNKNSFSCFNYHFDHWSGSDGNTYKDEEIIPANTFSVGDTLILTAVFTEDVNNLEFSEGNAEVDLIGGEKITVANLPGGTIYQIVEETPSGWQVIDTINVAGTIPPDGTANALVTNEYVPGTASITLTAVKTLDGRVPEEGAFEFELISDGSVVETISNNVSGIVQFSPLVFNQPGEFTYQIREVRGDDPGISYDSHTETITIEVVDDGNGNLTATSSAQTSTPRFENETKPGSLTITKQATGGSGDEIFTFEVTLTNEYGQSLDSVNIIPPPIIRMHIVIFNRVSREERKVVRI